MENPLAPEVGVLPERSIDQVVREFTQALKKGSDWVDALFQSIALWTTPDEIHDGRHYHYLIGGEAFDWLLLAERLVLSTDGLIDEDEREELLLGGSLPRTLTDEELKAAIGPAKYAAVMNYWYGVRVEEALVLANEYEVRKQRHGLQVEDNRLDDATYERVYGYGCAEMLTRYLADRSLGATDRMSLGELNEYTYWRFKFRVKRSDPARLASDTSKGMAFLQGHGRGLLHA